jgi:hypothetical protein
MKRVPPDYHISPVGTHAGDRTSKKTVPGAAPYHVNTRYRLDRISAMIERGTLNLPVGEVLELADASTATACWMVRLTSLERSCSRSQTDRSASRQPQSPVAAA